MITIVIGYNHEKYVRNDWSSTHSLHIAVPYSLFILNYVNARLRPSSLYYSLQKQLNVPEIFIVKLLLS